VPTVIHKNGRFFHISGHPVTNADHRQHSRFRLSTDKRDVSGKTGAARGRDRLVIKECLEEPPNSHKDSIHLLNALVWSIVTYKVVKDGPHGKLTECASAHSIWSCWGGGPGYRGRKGRQINGFAKKRDWKWAPKIQPRPEKDGWQSGQGRSLGSVPGPSRGRPKRERLTMTATPEDGQAELVWLLVKYQDSRPVPVSGLLSRYQPGST